MLFKIGALENFAGFTGKITVLDSLFNKVAGPQAFKFIKNILKQKRFLVKFSAF